MTTGYASSRRPAKTIVAHSAAPQQGSFIVPAANAVVHATVIRQLFGNDENGYRIVAVEVDGGKETWKGIMPPVSQGMELNATGSIVVDPKYPMQRTFNVVTCSSAIPTSGAALASYLASGPFPGVGPKTADAIIAMFGEQTKDILRLAATDPTKLSRVKGISAKNAQAIGESWIEQEAISPILIWLQDQGILANLAGKIAAKFKGNTIAIVKANPYRLTEVNGVGFKTADVIAMKLGIEPDSAIRAEAATMFALGEETNMGGHCWTGRDELARLTAKHIAQRTDICYAAINHLVQDSKVVAVGEQMYAARVYKAEQKVATCLAQLMAAKPVTRGGNDAATGVPLTLEQTMVTALEAFEKSTGMVLAQAQSDAVAMLVRNKVMVMTGGPGVGKTQATKAMLHVLGASGQTVIMCAPTGRAAKRMNELTGRPAATIHRTLGLKPNSNGAFEFDEGNPLNCDVLVIDEVSMIPVELMAMLLAATPLRARVLCVGDQDQLPSIGAGAVLRNMIESSVIPTTRLTQVFRQAAGSSIITNAHRINGGQVPLSDDEHDPKAQFIWYKETDTEVAADLIMRLVTNVLPQRFGFDPIKDIAVLSPMKSGPCGVYALNERLQAALNPSGKSYKHGMTTFILGDKVMQLKNDRARDVYNGDIGFVCDCDQEAKTLTVDMDGRKVEYTQEDLGHLTHAYACTGHKMQGSSAKCVVIPYTMSHWMMLNRPWIYTTVTRAEKLCVLVGDPAAMRKAVGEAKRDIRRTGLAALLRDAMPSQDVKAATLAKGQANLAALTAKDPAITSNVEVDPWGLDG